jgi:Putative peptidoglycan binding domain
MGIFSQPPSKTIYEFKKGDPDGVGVAALQMALNDRGFLDATGTPLPVDGNFGDQTDVAVRWFQTSRKLFVDGIAGLKTQTKLADEFGRVAKKANGLPSGLIYGLVEHEAGFRIGAVNWSVAGGVDCGYVQRRVYGPPWNEGLVQDAFDGQLQINKFAADTKAKFDRYMNSSRFPAVQGKPNPVEYAWRLACLYHNWPYAADRLGKGFQLSANEPSDPWWDKNLIKFRDGQPVVTYRDWAAYYAMGSQLHNHEGKVVRFAYNVPAYNYG